MKLTATIAMTAVVLACGASSAERPRALSADSVSEGGVNADSVRLTRNGEYMTVAMTLDLSDLNVSSNRAVLLTPRLVNGADTVDLPSVGVYGRRRYYTYVRNGKSMLSGADEQTFHASQRPDALPYLTHVDYAGWMDGAELRLDRREYGCCGQMLDERHAMLGRYEAPAPQPRAFFPELVYVRPQAERSKSRSLEGSAFIDFPVNKTVIYPDYRRNTAELGRIRATIDSVRDDRDVTITQVWLKGYASPESPYAHNRNLAIGRTAALKEYIQQLYHFGSGVIATDHEPEDWAGLRKRVEESNLDHRTEILALIDSDLDPDKKEWRIKSTYPDEYRFMLQNFYPALRHTDYRIAYEVRTYSNVEQIRRVFVEKPQKLSLNEFYLMAQEYEPGTDAFTEVFETAVRMYPDDMTANLNAANAAMRRGDNRAAARYLAKAGDSAEAVYARAALCIRQGDLTNARTLLKQAANMGLSQAEETLRELDK